MSRKIKYMKCKKVPNIPYICDGCPKYKTGGGSCPSRSKYERDRKYLIKFENNCVQASSNGV